MSDQCIIFSPERNQWTLADGRHHMEVPEWAREIMRGEFERETRPLRDNLDLALDSKRIAERRVTELLDENAKLVMKLNAEHLVRQNVERENAKLRELLSIMAYCNQFRRDCDGCSMNGAAGIITERAGCDELLARLRELGVEV